LALFFSYKQITDWYSLLLYLEQIQACNVICTIYFNFLNYLELFGIIWNLQFRFSFWYFEIKKKNDRIPMSDPNSPSNCGHFDIAYMIFQWDQITPSSSPSSNTATADVTEQVWKNWLQFWILLKNPVILIYITSHLGNIKFLTTGYLRVFCILWPN